MVNLTGELTDCSVDCCQGDLCNEVSDTTPKPEPPGKAFRIGCKLWNNSVCSCSERVFLTLYPTNFMKSPFLEKCKQMSYGFGCNCLPVFSNSSFCF